MQIKINFFGRCESDFESDDLFFCKKFLWKVKKSERWLKRKKYGEEESAKRNKCWAVHSKVKRINIALV